MMMIDRPSPRLPLPYPEAKAMLENTGAYDADDLICVAAALCLHPKVTVELAAPAIAALRELGALRDGDTVPALKKRLGHEGAARAIFGLALGYDRSST